MPEAARQIQLDPSDLGVDYAQDSFYTLIKNTLHRNKYVTAVQRLARHIIHAAEATPSRPCRVADLGPPRNAFTGLQRAVPADRRLNIIVAAPLRHSLPADRNPACYGSAPSDWNPFHPISTSSIALYIAN